MEQFSLEKYLENPNRKVVTRDGKDVRIICNDSKTTHPIVALVADGRDKEMIFTYWEDGSFIRDSKHYLDLFFVPVKKEGWVNIYYRAQAMICGLIYQSEENAKHQIDKDKPYITTTKIEWEE